MKRWKVLEESSIIAVRAVYCVILCYIVFFVASIQMKCKWWDKKNDKEVAGYEYSE